MVLLVHIFRSGHREQIREQVCFCASDTRLRQTCWRESMAFHFILPQCSFLSALSLAPFVTVFKTEDVPYSARKLWNLLPLQRSARTCSLKSVEKYRLLCLICCRHGQQWPAEHTNYDAIRQTRTTLQTNLQKCTHVLKGTYTHTVCMCPKAHSNYHHNGGLIKLPAQKAIYSQWSDRSRVFRLFCVSSVNSHAATHSDFIYLDWKISQIKNWLWWSYSNVTGIKPSN